MKYSRFYNWPIAYLKNFRIDQHSNFEEFKRDVDFKVNYFNSFVKKRKAEFKNFVENFENMDRQEFLKNYAKLYDIYVENLMEGYINKYIGKDAKIAKILTDDLIRWEGEDDRFYYYNGFEALEYRVICDKSFKIEDRVYTKKEIKTLCDAGKMLVLQTGNTNAYYKNKNWIGASSEHYYFDEISREDGERQVEKSKAININVGLPEEFKDKDHLRAASEKESFNEFCVENARFIDLIRSEFTKEMLTKDYEYYCTKYQEVKNKLIKNILKLNKLEKSMIKESEQMLEDVKSE